MTPEGKVKKDIRTQLLRWGLWPAAGDKPDVVNGWFYMPVNNGMGVSGIPDFVGCLTNGGRFFSIEAKAPKKDAAPRQKDRHEEIEAANGLIIVADCVEDIMFLEPYIGPQ